MYSRVTKFVKDCNILYDQQYGFRSKQSTQHAILDIVNTILQNVDNGKFLCGVFIDLKKAFDTVNHAWKLWYWRCNHLLVQIIPDWSKANYGS